MLATEWNLEDAIRVAREETWKEAQTKTQEEARETVFDIMKQATSMDELKRMLEASFGEQGKSTQ
jgi:hypothetical protein